MRAGVARTDITPPLGTALAGWAQPRQGSYVHQPLYAQALVLESQGEQAIIIALDLIAVDGDLTARIRARVQERTGVGGDRVLVNCSHTHSGPPFMRFFQVNVPVRDEAYVAQTVDQIAQVAAEAQQRLERVQLGYGTGHSEIAINRRKRGEDGMIQFPGLYWEEGPADREVTVVRLDRINGTPLVALVHYACHPIVSGPTFWIGPDYIGAMRQVIEAVHPGTTAFFLQGVSGDVRANERYAEGVLNWPMTTEMVDRVGRRLGAEALRVLQTITTAPAEGIASNSEVVPFFLSDGEQGGVVELCTLIFGPITLTGNGTEPFASTGLELKRRLGPGTLPLGYTNGMIGYVPTRDEYQHGGYEVERSHKHWRYSGPIRPGTAEELTEIQERLARTARASLT